MADFFWLSAAQFARLEPLLPTDTRGVPRVDDRRVISGIVHVLKSGGRGPTRRRSTARGRRSITASCAGPRRTCGPESSMPWLRQAARRRRC